MDNAKFTFEQITAEAKERAKQCTNAPASVVAAAGIRNGMPAEQIEKAVLKQLGYASPVGMNPDWD